MKTIKWLLLGALVVLFITGCAKNNPNKSIAYQNSSINKKITESTVLYIKDKSYVIQVKNVKKANRNICLKESKRVLNTLSSKTGLSHELVARNITDIPFGQKNKSMFIIRPIKYISTDAYTCHPDSLSFEVRLIDTEELTKNWSGKTKAEKVNILYKSYMKNVIWFKNFTWNFKTNKFIDDKNTNPILFREISNALDETNLFPPRIMNINEAIAKRAQDLKKKNSLKKENKELDERTKTLNTLAYTGCSNMKGRFDFGYSSKSKAMCLGKLSFVNVFNKYASQEFSILNANTSQHTFKLENSTCPKIVVTQAIGSLDDKNVSFKHTYKKQLLKHYKNKCSIDTIDGINFLACGNKLKNYFMELSNKNDNRIYKKYMVQTDRMCFNKFKKYFNQDKLDDTWRTKYGYNEKGFNFLGHNVLTDSSYGPDGFDLKGWNKDGINKKTKTLYNEDGFDVKGLHKYGVDADGWSTKLNKFVGKKVKRNLGFKALKLNTDVKNKFYNRNFYDEVSYIKAEKGFLLLGKKLYGDKKKPKKIELYYYRSVKGKLLDFENPKSSVWGKTLVLDKKVVREFDKNGIDKDGFDRHDWNKKLKKFRSQLVSK